MERTTMKHFMTVSGLSLAVSLAPACGTLVDLGESDGKINTSASGGSTSTERPDAGDTTPEGTGGAPTASGGGASLPTGGTRSSGGVPPTTTGGAAPVAFPEVIDRDYGPDSTCNPISTTPWDFNPCGRTTGLEFTPDGKLLIVATQEAPPNVHVFRLSDGALLRDFSGIANGAYHAVLSPSGKQLAVGGLVSGAPGEPPARVYDFETGEELYALPTHSGYYVGDVAFSADGTLLATGGLEGPIEIWNAADGKFITSFAYPNSVHHLQFAPSGTRLLVGGGDGRGVVWDFATRREVFVIEPIAQEMSGATFSPDGLFIASTTDAENALQIHTAAAGMPAQTLPAFHEAYVSEVIWVNRNHVVTNDWSGVIASWKRGASGQLGPDRAWITKGQSLGVAASPDGKTLAVGTARGSLGTNEAYDEGFIFLSL
jgi:WD40 repeat protein